MFYVRGMPERGPERSAGACFLLTSKSAAHQSSLRSGATMIFTHDTECALGIMVALVNSGQAVAGEERLPDVVALQNFVDATGMSDVPQVTEADLPVVQALRDRFHEVF